MKRVAREGTMLAPYSEAYVKAYNECMQDEELLDLTGSEALTLEQEFAMQKTWASDPARLCLLVLEEHSELFIGDVNLHLRTEELDEDEDKKNAERLLRVGELSVMICNSAARKRGHASRALTLLIQLLREHKVVDKLEARIKTHNAPSIALFAKLGFKEESVSEAFQETTMVYLLK